MKHAATRELFTYWNGLRDGRTAPERCDIDPAAIRGILADTFMLDVAEGFPVRLAGTRVKALLDAERRGDGFLDLWKREERRNLAAVLMAVADCGSPIVLGAAGAPAGRPECAFEMLFLPLRHFGKTHARILGIVTAAAQPASQPSWLGLMPVEPLAMRSLRIIDAAELATRPSAPAPCAPASCAPIEAKRREPRLPDVLQPSPQGLREVSRLGRLVPGRPALRLIEGGRPA